MNKLSQKPLPLIFLFFLFFFLTIKNCKQFGKTQKARKQIAEEKFGTMGSPPMARNLMYEFPDVLSIEYGLSTFFKICQH